MERFEYDRTAQVPGIVHIGMGAFHRAHQAWYTDRAMEGGDRDWAIIGVSLRSSNVAAQMNPQAGLYTLTERSEDHSKIRAVGAVQRVLVAGRDMEDVISLLAGPATRIVSLTITEQGYGRAPDGSLDSSLSGEGSIYPILATGLRRRRDAALSGVTLLCCDNLAENGRQFARLMADYCERHDPALGSWIASECSFPVTMVDRIVPATTPADRDEVETALGLRDEAAVLTEPFSQWVVEDRFVQGRPGWGRVGAQLVSDVRPYEIAKLRLLNGAHSALAYLGLQLGHSFVHEAIVDPAIRPLIERLMRHEASGSFKPASEQNIPSYTDTLLARFANAALQHRLDQIAIDGSQKLPQRWLETLAENQRQGRQCPAILTALAAWLHHIRGDNGFVDDPLADRLCTLWRQAGAAGILDAVFGARGLISSPWRPSRIDCDFVAARLTKAKNSARSQLLL